MRKGGGARDGGVDKGDREHGDGSTLNDETDDEGG